jgi:hypothetical protein
MNENDPPIDPLLGHGDFVARLQQIRDDAPAGDRKQDQLIESLVQAYDQLAEDGKTATEILRRLRVPLRNAITRQKINATALYEALTRVGLSTSHQRFTRAVLPSGHASPRKDAIACTEWRRLLKRLTPQLLDMLRVGCTAEEIVASLARRDLHVPPDNITDWYAHASAATEATTATDANRATNEGANHNATAHTKPARAARLIHDFERRYRELNPRQFSLTIDTAHGMPITPFRVAVFCASAKDEAFARRWLEAGIHALQPVTAPPASSTTAPTPRRAGATADKRTTAHRRQRRQQAAGATQPTQRTRAKKADNA